MKVPELARGGRLDRAVRDLLAGPGREVSIREVRSALREGRILIDGRARAPGDRALGGETVSAERFVPRAEAIVSPEPELLASVAVVFEDAEVLALAKPSGLPTAPLEPGERWTLLGAAIARAPSVAGSGPPLEGGLCHRLDIETSGCVLFAKDRETRGRLRGAFSAHAVEKGYLAIVGLAPSFPDQAIAEGRITGGPQKDRVRVLPRGAEAGLEARTEVRVLERFGSWALVEAIARTGRRHQVRAHLAALGVPIAGDRLYGRGDEGIVPRLALHASRVTLPDGRTIVAPLAEDLAAALEKLRRGG